MRYSCTSGHLNAKVVIVGDSLTEHEKAEGKPFMGTSGDFLFNTLGNISKVLGYPITRSDCYITNVFKEIPPRNRERKHDIEEWLTSRSNGRTDLPRIKKKYLGHVAAPHYILFKESRFSL